jgi:nitroreductase
MIPHEIVRRLVECGVRASSADNCQPWRFVFTGDRLEVFLKRADAFYDVDFLPSYFALGGVIENIRIAASHLGYRADITPLPEGEQSELAATVSLARAHPMPPDPLYSFLHQRCTNRRPYSRLLPPLEVRESLAAVAPPGSGFRVVLATEKVVRRKASSLMMQADWIRFEHERTHREFHAKLRFTKDEKERTGDGLSLDTLELGPLGGPLLRFHRPWKRTARLNRWGLSRLMALQTYLLAFRAGAVGLLLGPPWTPLTSLQGGEIFHRMWLTATRHDLAVQPMAALPLYLLRVERAGEAGFEARHLRLLRSLKAGLIDAFQVRPQEGVIMLFRLGHAPAPTGRSARRPVSEVLSFQQRDHPGGGPSAQRQ